MNIPKLIHQTWKNKTVPEQFKAFADSWKEKHPHYDYMLWTDEMNRNFIKAYFPDFIKKYDNYPADIQRVDAVRYLVLYKMGGIYIDLDFECLKNIEPLLEDQFCVFGKEPEEHCKIHRRKLIISNAFMAVTSGNHFFEILCQQLHGPDIKPAHRFNDILESTGPFMLTRMYQNYPFKKDIKLLDDALIYPLTKNELAAMGSGKIVQDKVISKIDKAYALHYYHGTWWKNKQ